MIPWVLAIAVAAPEQAPVADYRSYVDQARFFLKKGWHADAEEQLDLAVRHPDGKLDAEAWFLLAKVRYELADLPGARSAAAQAVTWSRDERQADTAREWLGFLEERFGMVTLLPPRAGLSSRVEIALQGTLLDPELKAWFQRAEDRLEGVVDLPVTLGLPAGFTYEINGHNVDVQAGETVQMPIEVNQLVAQSTEVQLSVGVGAWVGGETSNLYPAPQAELGVVLPLGRLLLGARAGLIVQPYQLASGSSGVGPAGSVTAELGIEDGREDALAIRGGLSFRYAGQPGLQVGCEACEQRATALIPGGWVSVLFLDRRRSSSLGVGFRLTTEYALGRTRDGAAWASPGIRGLLDVSWAL